VYQKLQALTVLTVSAFFVLGSNDFSLCYLIKFSAKYKIRLSGLSL